MDTLNLHEFKKMTEIFGYAFDEIIVWHKCGKSNKRWRLISTDFEVYGISKIIRKKNVD